MNYKSLSLSFRIGLAFHAMNNEGSSGTNVMEPRRISVGGNNYDGISGEMVRRHVFENLVKIVKAKKLALSNEGEGLQPDRAKNLIVSYLKSPKSVIDVKDGLKPIHLPIVTKMAMDNCTIIDIGGYLAASDEIKGTTPKRDSVFDVGWLISEEPAIVEFAQHASYNSDSSKNNLFTQNMRAAVYGGVARLDLGRIGYNDWAWLTPEKNDLHLSDDERKNRAAALVDAWEQWLLSPAGAKQAGWLQHTGQLEGAIVLSNFGPAPFRSPIEVELKSADKDNEEIARIKPNSKYQEQLIAVGQAKPDRYQVFTFSDQASLITSFDLARKAVGV